MDISSYTALTRQSGLMREMQIIANNIANTATTGFRQEGVFFSEYLPKESATSMANANIARTNFAQGGLIKTGNSLDIALQGDGFFLVETPAGTRLTRSGNFNVTNQGDLVTNDGFAVLDAGEAPIFVPTGRQISISADGTLSADAQPLGQLGIVQVDDTKTLIREDGVMFEAPDGWEISNTARVLQGHLEKSNSDAVSQIARMIEVQRGYELGQKFLDAEDERQRGVIKALMR